MTTDRSTVEAVVKHYFDGLYEGDADKLGAIFDSSADLRWVEKGELQVLSVPDWLDRVRKRPGVIFGSDGLDGCEHAVFEILSNSIDEAREGHRDEVRTREHVARERA